MNALFFVAGTASNPGRLLRVAGELAGHLHTGARAIGVAQTEAEVKTALLPELAIRQYALLPEGRDATLIGCRVGDLDLPSGVEVAAVTRFGVAVDVDADLVLEGDDQLTLVGPDGVMPPAGEPVPTRSPPV